MIKWKRKSVIALRQPKRYTHYTYMVQTYRLYTHFRALFGLFPRCLGRLSAPFGGVREVKKEGKKEKLQTITRKYM